jgi:putative membrane protein
MMWGWGWGDMWIGGLMMLVFWVALIAAIVWLAHSLGGRPTPDDRSGARRILDERFASGEISEEEYQRRRQALSH